MMNEPLFGFGYTDKIPPPLILLIEVTQSTVNVLTEEHPLASVTITV